MGGESRAKTLGPRLAPDGRAFYHLVTGNCRRTADRLAWATHCRTVYGLTHDTNSRFSRVALPRVDDSTRRVRFGARASDARYVGGTRASGIRLFDRQLDGGLENGFSRSQASQRR